MKLEDPKVDVMTLDYVPTIWDTFTRKVTLDNGNLVEVDVWDTEGKNFNTILLLHHIIILYDLLSAFSRNKSSRLKHILQQ